MRIATRSRRQAMDWSLVLISQGVEAAIEAPGEEPGWSLRIRDEDAEVAANAIRLYEQENRGWPWQRALFQQRLLFDWASLAWVALCVLFFLLDEALGLRQAGLLEMSALRNGQWWRLFTAVWLHADAAHLAANGCIGLVLLGLAMARFGTGTGLLASYLAGVGGNLLAWWLAPARGGSLGASGMVMGSLGLIAIQSLSGWRKNQPAVRTAAGGVLGGVMLFVLLGLNPGTDLLAHLGGFISGLLFGTVLIWVPFLAQNAIANLVSALFFALMVILPWIVALRHPSPT